MIGSGTRPVAAECGPTGHNFSKGMAGQGRAGQNRRQGKGKGQSRAAGQGRPGIAGKWGASQTDVRDCLDPRGPGRPKKATKKVKNAWRPLRALGGPCKAPGRAGRPLGAWEARARASQGNLEGHRVPGHF